jgi:hypothetical protein
MKARVSNLAKTEAEWDKLNFTPLVGEFIIYIPDENYNYARVKVGDGITPLHQLSFFTDAVINVKLAEYQQASVCDAGYISDYFV